MFTLDADNMILTRGDTLYLEVDLTVDHEPYTLQDGDSVRFAMKLKYTDEDCLIYKELYLDADNKLILHLEPQDTKPFAFKRYVYDIQITFANGDVYTFKKGNFTLSEEVE